MTAQFSTMIYQNRYLILKTVETRQPFVIAECYLPEVASQICDLLQKQFDESQEPLNES